MRNENMALGARILLLTENLPYFHIDSLRIFGASQYHLRIVLSRLVAQGRILRLKKGMYVSKEYINTVKIDNLYSTYLEFIATKICEPSYLSLEYVLYENNVLTDIPSNFTLITTRKTYSTESEIGTFMYHKIKDELFHGYNLKKTNSFFYRKASKTKALFDFLYLRRKLIVNRLMMDEQRLNLDIYSKKDMSDLEQYIAETGSKKMEKIYTWVKNHV